MEDKSPNQSEIQDSELNSFVLAVKTRFGLDFSGYEKKSLKRGLVRLMMRYKTESVLGLWALMLRNKDLIVSYVDELMVNLTEFFRNPEVWQKIKTDITPFLATNPQINIWHAGCSSGEEVYSNCILLRESFLLRKAKILATDLSTKVLAKAIEGNFNNLTWKKYIESYTAYNPSGNPEQYFIKNENEYIITDQLKKNIRFEQHNLVQDEIKEQFDLVFCRNVMIYFDEVLKMKTLRRIHAALNTNGFFIIGYYDMLPDESKQLFEVYCPSTRIYRKKN